ncbi:allophanate hydrolase [Peribacillus sp. NPDC097284]|uniref:allophanate hydrolase n=1 Tax=Peribacillus sp. NPDC097284 TaxID=3364401 RepID=UPI0037FFD9FC
MMNPLLSINNLQQAYADGSLTPRQVVTDILQRVEDYTASTVFIVPPTWERLTPYVEKLERVNMQNFPLYGIPFVIKDNIDWVDVDTTAACPTYAYTPTESATVVQRLIDAGAIPIGKTNLDQFATGLIGTRSPYGVVKNALNEELISGGSSSGSAVAVALGFASFGLGTDTAGSGRVPAALNELYGLKPSLGAWPVKGVVPACESLDCVTVFATELQDVYSVDAVVRGEDAADIWSRAVPLAPAANPAVVCLPKNDLTFFGPYAHEYEAAWNRTVQRLENGNVPIRYIDVTYLQEAAAILYDGPWIAERWSAIGDFVEDHPDEIFDVTRQLLRESENQTYRATELFQAMHRLQALKKRAMLELENAVLVLPTTGGTWTIQQAKEDPISTNQQLGLYTNHCNLLDLAAIAVPADHATADVPFGITLFSRFDEEHLLKGLATTIERGNTIPVAVCGLHMRGFALEHQMLECQATFAYQTTTASTYRLYQLATQPAKPGLVRGADGVAIEVEVWDMPIAQLGAFMQRIPAPLGMGKVQLANGLEVLGFICEPDAIEQALDISYTGGWRYLETTSIE